VCGDERERELSDKNERPLAAEAVPDRGDRCSQGLYRDGPTESPNKEDREAKANRDKDGRIPAG
jgi:hypothetical protein